MSLYPLKFNPILKERIWGGEKIKTVLNKDFSPLPNCGESWEISGVDGNVSVVCNGILKNNSLAELVEIYMGDLVGEKNYERFGNEFPLLIKFIDSLDNLSVQVHPDDELSKKRHNAYGKTEMWYVVDAEPGAKLISGFRGEVSKEMYLKAVEDENVESVLNLVEVAAGDVFFMPAGRVHAIGKGLLVAEIQQTSDVTYRIYDYKRKDADGNERELHTELAIDAIDYEKIDNVRTDYDHKASDVNIARCNYFTTNRIFTETEKIRDLAKIDSFIIYMCLSGEVDIVDDEGNKETLVKGETVLIPALVNELRIVPKTMSLLLETYV
ncbi:MAG: type I phosphomannose isomerase catalytic subunit [Bacteroidales bacterium]